LERLPLRELALPLPGRVVLAMAEVIGDPALEICSR
jgi:hypothetical protein